ncbi:MAG: hypothetical protein ACREP7_00745 [Lysobacter sp.]
MPKLHANLEPGQVILIPPGVGASITYIEKSGRRARVEIECSEPVTITTASSKPQQGPALVARRPTPRISG